MSGPRVTCLIPAWNEAPRIGAVLAAVTGHPMVDEVVVIDDGSTDGTPEVARAAGAQVLSSGGNLGKTRALALGLRRARGPHVLLLDADLTGITAADVTALLNPVLSGRAEAAISLRGNAPRTWRLIGIDYISGERVVPRAMLEPVLDELDRLPRFGFEVFLNRLLIAKGAPLAIIAWPGVASPSKAAKRGGLVAGLTADARMLADIFRTIPPWTALAQIVALRSLARDGRG